MLRPDVDVAILGGGCAGLSLAVRLAAVGRSLCVIEPRTDYHDDRAWSFWRTAPDPFEDCVRASWRNWDVAGPHGVVRRGSSKLRYQSVAAGPFYDRARSLITDSPVATLSLGISAYNITKTSRGWQITTSAGAISAAHVVDTRPPNRPATYGQYFLGWEISTERPVFDPDRVQLMQFRPARSSGVDFVYILPFARDRALVEVTCFAAQSPGAAILQQWLETEIAMLEPGAFEIVRVESGALPMEVGFAEPCQDGVMQMGLCGGAARPSTGYAFARIQAQANYVTTALQQGTTPQTQLDGLATRFMDRIFLRVLQTAPERAPAIFESLFRYAPSDRLERFLSGSTHPIDRLAVMASLPTLPFLKAALVPA